MCFANVVYPFYTFMSVPAFVEKSTLQLLWLVFVPGLLNIAICALLIPVWGYKVAIYSTMFSYWSQLLIPLYNHFYKQHVSAWLGNLKKIFVVLCLFVGCVILFNYINNVALGYKAVISLLVLMLFGGIYSLKNLYKVL
jgi:O-antigen/teichoic acid export membrane protein